MHPYPHRPQHVKVTTNSVGFTGLLALLFIGLKLGGIIDWSWWFVLGPLWMPMALVVALMLLAVLGIVTARGILALAAWRKTRRSPK